MAKYTPEELNNFSKEQLISLYENLQDQMEKLNLNMEAVLEQIRLANQQRFGRKTEKLDQITGQLYLFNEVEEAADLRVGEPSAEEVITGRKKKQKGKREEDVKDLPRETHEYKLTDEELDAFYGRNCWRRMPPDTYTTVRCVPAVYTAEDHIIDVAVGTDGDHQDEFLRADHPKRLLKRSVATPSLAAAIINGKYTNALPLYRIEQELQTSGLNISRQTMANWMMILSQKYLGALWERLKEEELKGDVIQADETTCQVIHDNDPSDPEDKKSSAGHKNYMWIYRTGQFNTEHPIVLFDYQRGRHHKYPEEFLRGYEGYLETDALNQYYMLEKTIPGLINANCWVHARRDFAEALKALDKNAKAAASQTIAGQALAKIAKMYDIENDLAKLTPEERLRKRNDEIKPLVDDFFAWLKRLMTGGTVLPKGETARGINYCLEHESRLRVFLENGNVPMDNSASERAIRPFTIGRKNWVLINSVRGARASAVIYSLVETAKLNGLNVYRYMEYLLTELPKLADDNDKGNIDTEKLDPLLPWSDQLPAQCQKNRR